MKKLGFIVSVIISLITLNFAGCSHDNEVEPERTYDVSGVVLPKAIDCKIGQEIQIKVVAERGPAAGDKIVFASAAGTEYLCEIVSTTKNSFSFVVPEGFVTGYYSVSIVHDQLKLKVGDVQINISNEIEVDPTENANIYGVVECGGEGIPGVVVSDGYQVVVTDNDGVYNMVSEKKHGYVFISVPSGYEVPSNGLLPAFHQNLTKSVKERERADFSLSKSLDQTNHTMLVFGDIHLANRTNDRKQFMDFTADVNKYLAENQGKPVYGLTLGDMSWDLYWISNSYDLNNYLLDMAAVKNLKVFHTIGNHDHEMGAAGDFDTVVKYKKIIGPTYYSFNIGKVHYVVLDDIECTNDGTNNRSYNDKIVNEEIEWLKKDLEYVDKSTPVVVAMHAPMYKDDFRIIQNGILLRNALSGHEVYFLTGHTHVVRNIEKKNDNIFELNSGAVCATWWWTGNETPGIHLCQDGAPGGYRVFTASETDFSWYYKTTDKPADYQFRTYDRNQIELTPYQYVPSANQEYQSKFIELANEYSSKSDKNYVYINVWDYDPAWIVTVTENGKELPVKNVSKKDPLHIISYPAKRWNKNKGVTFETESASHFFEVQASSPTSTLEITVTDRFGKTYKETMSRPKEFTVDNYK